MKVSLICGPFNNRKIAKAYFLYIIFKILLASQAADVPIQAEPLFICQPCGEKMGIMWHQILKRDGKLNEGMGEK